MRITLALASAKKGTELTRKDFGALEQWIEDGLFTSALSRSSLAYFLKLFEKAALLSQYKAEAIPLYRGTLMPLKVVGSLLKGKPATVRAPFQSFSSQRSTALEYADPEYGKDGDCGVLFECPPSVAEKNSILRLDGKFASWYARTSPDKMRLSVQKEVILRTQALNGCTVWALPSPDQFSSLGQSAVKKIQGRAVIPLPHAKFTTS